MEKIQQSKSSLLQSCGLRIDTDIIELKETGTYSPTPFINKRNLGKDRYRPNRKGAPAAG